MSKSDVSVIALSCAVMTTLTRSSPLTSDTSPNRPSRFGTMFSSMICATSARSQFWNPYAGYAAGWSIVPSQS